MPSKMLSPFLCCSVSPNRKLFLSKTHLSLGCLFLSFLILSFTFQKPEMGGPVFDPRSKRHIHEVYYRSTPTCNLSCFFLPFLKGGKCYVGHSPDPVQTATTAKMNPLFFRALSFPSLTNCSRELLDAILAL